MNFLLIKREFSIFFVTTHGNYHKKKKGYLMQKTRIGQIFLRIEKKAVNRPFYLIEPDELFFCSDVFVFIYPIMIRL